VVTTYAAINMPTADGRLADVTCSLASTPASPDTVVVVTLFVLAGGSLPLDVLQDQIAQFIAEQQARPPAS
jgi:hypothetical protein